jgi:hypothetical protein
MRTGFGVGKVRNRKRGRGVGWRGEERCRLGKGSGKMLIAGCNSANAAGEGSVYI